MAEANIQSICDLSNTALVECKLIPLTQGQFAIVDASDYDWLMQWKWYCSSKGYAARTISHFPIKICWMHRLIIGTPIGVETDHINGDKLDNRRSNLRICSREQNTKNARKLKVTSSKYKGVHWNKARKKWQVEIQVNKKQIYLGLFLNEEIAALTYNIAAQKYHGEFARLNELPHLTA